MPKSFYQLELLVLGTQWSTERLLGYIEKCKCGRNQILFRCIFRSRHCVTAFKAPYLQTSVKGGAQIRCVIASIVAAFTQHV